MKYVILTLLLATLFAANIVSFRIGQQSGCQKTVHFVYAQFGRSLSNPAAAGICVQKVLIP